MSGTLRTRLAPVMVALHRWLGMATGLLLLVTAVTGCGLLLTDLANWRGHVPVEAGAGLGDISPALAEAVSRHPEYALTNVLLPRDPTLGWIALLRHPETDDRIIADIDPYTGRLLGYRDFDRTVFRILLDVHYTYLSGTVGKIAAAGVSIAFLVLSVSGIWIYRGALRGLFGFRTGPHAGAVGRLHKWTGVWALVLAFIWSATGFVQMTTILSLAFSHTKRFVASNPSELQSLPHTGQFVEWVKRSVRGGEIISFAPPQAGQSELRVFVLVREAWPWNKRVDVFVDSRTGAVSRVVHPGNMNPAQRFSAAVHALHFGFYSPNRTLAVYVMGGLLVMTLPVTGFWMWWRRARRANR